MLVVPQVAMGEEILAILALRVLDREAVVEKEVLEGVVMVVLMAVEVALAKALAFLVEAVEDLLVEAVASLVELVQVELDLDKAEVLELQALSTMVETEMLAVGVAVSAQQRRTI